jgi:hypothetical protein
MRPARGRGERSAVAALGERDALDTCIVLGDTIRRILVNWDRRRDVDALVYRLTLDALHALTLPLKVRVTFSGRPRL